MRRSGPTHGSSCSCRDDSVSIAILSISSTIDREKSDLLRELLFMDCTGLSLAHMNAQFLPDSSTPLLLDAARAAAIAKNTIVTAASEIEIIPGTSGTGGTNVTMFAMLTRVATAAVIAYAMNGLLRLPVCFRSEGLLRAAGGS